MYDIVYYRGHGYLVIEKDDYTWVVHSVHEESENAELIVEALRAREAARER